MIFYFLDQSDLVRDGFGVPGREGRHELIEQTDSFTTDVLTVSNVRYFYQGLGTTYTKGHGTLHVFDIVEPFQYNPDMI